MRYLIFNITPHTKFILKVNEPFTLLHSNEPQNDVCSHTQPKQKSPFSSTSLSFHAALFSQHTSHQRSITSHHHKQHPTRAEMLTKAFPSAAKAARACVRYSRVARSSSSSSPHFYCSIVRPPLSRSPGGSSYSNEARVVVVLTVRVFKREREGERERETDLLRSFFSFFQNVASGEYRLAMTLGE